MAVLDYLNLKIPTFVTFANNEVRQIVRVTRYDFSNSRTWCSVL